MRIVRYTLPEQSLGTVSTLESLHFGPPEAAQKAYLQAGLHADEIPGLLVLEHLTRMLERAEAGGHLQGELVLVPVANPLGLSQVLLHQGLGRFELGTAENFNRHFTDLFAATRTEVLPELSVDSQENVARIRAAMRSALDHALNQPAVTALEALRLTLQRLACDADIVLDLHCDEDAVVHLYTETPFQAHAEPLARYLGARALLVTLGEGAQPFDEALSGPWWRYAEAAHSAPGGPKPVPLACFSATVELRGKSDVDDHLARQDAEGLYRYLQHAGFIAGVPAPLPPLLAGPTPLAGTEQVSAPQPGVVVFAAQPGDWIKRGQIVAEIIDVQRRERHPLTATVDGLLYARSVARYVRRGTVVARIAGAKPIRSGPLLSP